jgi:hypothetical protein
MDPEVSEARTRLGCVGGIVDGELDSGNLTRSAVNGLPE